MIAMGKIGVRSGGVSGSSVRGLRNGPSGSGKSARMLYQRSGISFSVNRYLVVMLWSSAPPVHRVPPRIRLAARPGILERRHFEPHRHATRVARRTDGAAVRLHQLAGDGKPDAGATAAACTAGV